MTDRIDHAVAAREYLDERASMARPFRPSGEELAAVAQVYATLALVEQQRIANTIALAGWQDFGPDGRQARIASFHPDGTLREDIREGLGL